LEYSDDGWAVEGSAAGVSRRRVPSFSAKNGSWALRTRIKTAGAQIRPIFSGGESDSIPVTGSQWYYLKMSAARDTPSRTDMRFNVTIRWRDEDENVISTSAGSNVALTTAATWYDAFVLAQAPAGAVRAQVMCVMDRSGGANITVGDVLWTDAVWMMECDSSGTTMSGITYFDGDTLTATGLAYTWSGQVAASQSLGLENTFKTVADTLATRFGSTSIRATRIRWNAQESLSSVSSLVVGKTLSLVYKGTTTTYRIIGITGDISPERYMIDYYLWKI
jgi:hypothetical protein